MEAATATMPPVDLAAQPPEVKSVEETVKEATSHEKSDLKTVVDETVAFLQSEICAQESNVSTNGEMENDAEENVEETSHFGFVEGARNGKVEVVTETDSCVPSENERPEQDEIQDRANDATAEATNENDELVPMQYNEDEQVWVKIDEQTDQTSESLDENIAQKLESDTIVVVSDGAEKAGNNLVIVEDAEQTEEPARAETDLPMKLELHISESDLIDRPDETNEALSIETTEGKDAKEIYSCQSSPGYIKPPTKSTIVKQRSLDTQGPSDDEAESGRSKRGSLHSPSSKILTKMTPITWDQWMKRPASYIPPQKSPEKDSKPAAPATEVDGGKTEEKKEAKEESKKGESPKVKKTRFQIIPQSADVLDINREDPKVLETFDETEEDKFLMENPNVLVESHLNQLTMVESQLKKLGAAAKVGVCTKRLGQPEPDQKNMGRASSGDQKSKGWLGWLSVFNKKSTPPSPPIKKQPARKPCPQHSRPTARQHARPAGPILANYDPKMVTVVEVQ